MREELFNRIDFKQTERGNAYNYDVLEENEQLILAFNDTFIQIFTNLAEKIFATHEKLE